MVNREKSIKERMIETFNSINGGLEWAEEWVEICTKLSPTRKNIENQYEALLRMEKQKYARKIL